jgi:geranylgeranyl pyrophosphate synthase
MAEATHLTDTSEADIAFIYEPIQPQLDLVVENLRGLAVHENLTNGAELFAHAVLSGGKKIRPTITLLAGALWNGSEETLVTMGTAIELLHIASLVHDDTVDKADTRRGKATVSSIWGNNVAVLLGDYVFASSATFVCDTGNIRVVRRFSETIMELAQGELTEHFSTNNWNQTVEDYSRRIYDKTASLFCTASESGGVLSGAPEDKCDALNQYGYNLGMAFQIMDDVLDFMGTEEEMGKPVGNDLVHGTLTLPVLLFGERNPDQPSVRRLQAGGTDPADVQEVINLVRESSVIPQTLAIMDDYRNKARAALQRVPAHRARESLEALVNYIGKRRA